MTTHDFDKDFWEQHWGNSPGTGAPGRGLAPPNPYVVDETRDLSPRNALDAGCGAGTEAIWLAGQGWQVTAADISGKALTGAARRAQEASVSDRITWVEADLTDWDPDDRWDLVVTHYAHSTMPQLDFYQRIAQWVAPAGTLLIVGHLHGHGAIGPGHHPPEEATATPAGITAGLDPEHWTIETADEYTRTVPVPDGEPTVLRDVVVRATRRR